MYKFLNKIRIKTYSANNPCRSGGFTIVELLVTTTIFVLITSISLVKNAEFNSSISITNLAYEVALQIREAQSYGVSVKEFGVGTGNFDVAYGVYFIDSVNDSFIFFADENKNEKYNASNGEFIDQLSTIGGNEISMFCATPTSGPEVCSDDGSATFPGWRRTTHS